MITQQSDERLTAQRAVRAAAARRRYHASEENRQKSMAATRKWARTHPEKYKALGRKMTAKARAKNPRACILRNISQNARKKGLPFNIVESDLIWPTHCPVLGIELVYIASGRRVAGSASIDRFDNSLGYVKGNVRVVSWRANNLKSDATLDELLKVVDYMRGNNQLAALVAARTAPKPIPEPKP